MKFLAVKLEGTDLIDCFCGYSTRMKIKDLQGPRLRAMGQAILPELSHCISKRYSTC